MTTEYNFVCVPLDGRDISELEAQLREHTGPGGVSVQGAVSSGMGSAAVRVPDDGERRSEVLRIVRAWRDGGPPVPRRPAPA